MQRAHGLVGLALFALAAAPGVAHADPMDVSLARLRTPVPCGGVEAGAVPCQADNRAWANLVSELGGATMPVILSPARTTGYGGFELTFEGWLTGIQSGRDYWQVGTEGDELAGAEGRNRFPDDVLFWMRAMARKGFPLGFELGTGFSYLLNTSLWAWALEVKWSLFEGFRSGVPGVIPDISVRGMVNTVVGDSEFNLTVPSVDITISKPIILGNTTRLTPFVAWQIGWIFGDTELVDLTPTRDAFAECRPDTSGAGTSCTVAPPAAGYYDYENNSTFDQLRMSRQRLHFGLQFQYNVVLVTGALAFDLIEPGDLNDELPQPPTTGMDPDETSNERVLPRQWTVAFSVGARFN